MRACMSMHASGTWADPLDGRTELRRVCDLLAADEHAILHDGDALLELALLLLLLKELAAALLEGCDRGKL